MTAGATLPPGWRSNWRPPRSKGARGEHEDTRRPAEHMADVVRAVMSAPAEVTRSPEDIRAMVVRVLCQIAEDSEAPTNGRVGACRLLSELHASPAVVVAGWGPPQFPPQLSPAPFTGLGSGATGATAEPVAAVAEEDDGSWK